MEARKKTARFMTLFFALFFVISAAVPCFAEDEEEKPLPDTPNVTHAKAAYLYNFENDRVLYEYEASSTQFPTSTAKLMTAIVVFDECGDDLGRKITVTEEMKKEFSGNRIGFSVGEVVTVEQMLYCMLVNSANDAAIILAHGIAGNTEEFVKLMNEKAAWIGAYNTHYTNPTGMHNSEMVTTAIDTATIAKYAYKIPGFIDMTSTPKYVMESTNMSDYRNIYNRNSLISKYYNVGYLYSPAIGMNAGATTQGGYSICAVAEDNERGLTYLAVVLGAEVENLADENGNPLGDVYHHYQNAINMFEWAFAYYDYTKVLSSSMMVCELGVNLSSALDHVTLVPERDITVYLPTKVEVNRDITYSYNTYYDTIDAPIQSGTEAGIITVMYGDEILGSCSLVTTSSIARSEFLYFLSQMAEFVKGRFFRGTVIAMVVICIIYVIYRANEREKRLRRMASHLGPRRYK